MARRIASDRIIKEKSFDYAKSVLCNCCGIECPKKTAITYNYFEESFLFCSDECFGHYLGEILAH